MTSRIATVGFAFAVGWIARMTEEMLTATAWGGPFTIFLSWVVIFYLTLFDVGAAILVGQVLRLRPIQAAWMQAGYWVLLLALPPLLVLIFSRPLGLRTIEPVSHYSLMVPLWLHALCYFLIAFALANLPLKRPPDSPASLPGH